MDELQIGIGTKDAVTLKPLNVIIKEAAIEKVGTKEAKKVVFSCMHPDSNDLIKISSVKWENKGKLEVTGLWYNVTEEDGVTKIKKGSALAVFLQNNQAGNISAMVGKSIATTLDDKSYLCFKNY